MSKKKEALLRVKTKDSRSAEPKSLVEKSRKPVGLLSGHPTTAGCYLDPHPNYKFLNRENLVTLSKHLSKYPRKSPHTRPLKNQI